jgi:hypothetical protein
MSHPAIAPSRPHRQNKQRPLTRLKLVRSRSNVKDTSARKSRMLRGVGQGRAVTACAGSALPLEEKTSLLAQIRVTLCIIKLAARKATGGLAAGNPARPRCHPSAKLEKTPKNASTAGAKSVILWRGSKLSERLQSFSRRAAKSGQGPLCLRRPSGLIPKNSRQGLSPSPIGSLFIARPWPLNVHAGFEGMRLQNCIGSG